MITSRLVSRWADNIIPLERVKQHLVVEHDDDDLIIELYRDTAIEHVENVTRRTLPLSQYRMRIDAFCDEINLRNPPIRAITELTYMDDDDVRQTIPTDDMSINTDYEWVRLKPKTAWPSGRDLELMVIAGYGDYVENPIALPYTLPMVLGGASDKFPLPRPLELAILLLTSHWYENREPVTVGITSQSIPHGVNSLLFKYRNYRA